MKGRPINHGGAQSVELNLSGKSLGASVDVVCEGLLEQTLVTLGECHLASNELTTSCLPSLASVVAASATDLRVLDLSDNGIAIMTTEDERAWTEFVSALSDCKELESLNLVCPFST